MRKVHEGAFCLLRVTSDPPKYPLTAADDANKAQGAAVKSGKAIRIASK